MGKRAEFWPVQLRAGPTVTDKQIINRFNRGEVDRRATARQDVERITDSATLVENFMPIRLGGMQYRPGFEVLQASLSPSYCIPFVAATADVALIEVGDSVLQVWVNDAPISRVAVTATVANGGFDTTLTSWTNVSGVGGSATWATGGFLQLIGNGTNEGRLYQTITVTETGTEHALRINIQQGAVNIQIGTTVGGTEIYSGVLGEGTHSLAFTPAGNFTIQFSNPRLYAGYVNSVQIEGVGVVSLPIARPADLSTIRYAQSLDVVFFAGGAGAYPQRIERRGPRSWSVVIFRANDGPFEVINTSGVTLTPNAYTGDGTMTASRAFFKSAQMGALFKLTSPGQYVSANVAAANVQTSSIRVTGTGTGRIFSVSIQPGPLVATITLQRSLDDATWVDLTTYTAATTTTYNDAADNQIIYYRLNVKGGAYTSGTFTMFLSITSGTTTGVARVVSYTSPTLVNVQIYQPFGSLAATADWYEGSWSTLRGQPSSVALHEGRLWFAGKNRLWGSVSDVFDSFDRDVLGDSASIQRTIGFGPADRVEWLFSATRLLMGLASNEISVRSNSFDQPLTSLNTNLKKGSNQGAAPYDVVEVDNKAYFIQRSQLKIFEMDYTSDNDSYPSIDTNVLTPRLCGSSTYLRMAVTRQPETRLWVVLADGTMRVYLNDVAEEVRGWSRVTLATGTFKDIVVLPGLREDVVYAIVDIGGTRYMTRLAMFENALGASKSQHLDLGKTYTSPGTSLTGLAHLNGQTVRVWADAQDRGTFAVSGGTVTLPANAWVNVTVGLAHTANWTSNKLTDYITDSVINQNKRVERLGVVLENTVTGTFKYGADVASLDVMPLIEDGQVTSQTAVTPYYDELPFEFDGTYDSDSRVHLQATGPATVLSLSFWIDDPNPTKKMPWDGS